jgi:hypothetical protein
MGLMNLSLPWRNSTNMYLTLLLFPTSKFKGFCSHSCLYLCRSVELDHVKPSLVHEFFRIQSIGIIPLE